ncbi:hypothetical protein V5O48_010240 [Marasmius crinis-equi]|uniref:Uncharacterized protein n=1 Tax=Marasmius crinis-equi TaxID=585013 RepID=A0ABR3F8W6_9AGAR
MATDIDELNEQIFQSFENDPFEIDVEILSDRSFYYSFCGGIELQYSPTWPAEPFLGSVDLSLEPFIIEDPFSHGTNTTGKRKLELEDVEELEMVHRRTRTRTSSSNGLLPSYNCLANLDLRAHRAFQAYRDGEGRKAASRARNRRARSLTTSLKGSDESNHTILTPSVHSQASGFIYSPAISEIENAKTNKGKAKDTAKSKPSSPTKPSGLSNRNINVAQSTPSSSLDLFSTNDPVSLPTPLVQLLSDYNFSTAKHGRAFTTPSSFSSTTFSTPSTSEPSTCSNSNASWSSSIRSTTPTLYSSSQGSAVTVRITSSNSDEDLQNYLFQAPSSPLARFSTRRNWSCLGSDMGA